MVVSPFSLEHDWAVHWTRIPSHFQPHSRINGESPIDKIALKALACVGLISGNQLMSLFSIDKRRLKKLLNEHKLIRHELKLNNQSIPIYTLGINGAVIAGVEGYKHNYWVEYKIEDILKRILFFRLYERFPPVQIMPAMSPFIGSFKLRDNIFYVYPLRGNANDLLMYLKWNHFDGRLIMITEKLSHLHEIKPFLHNLNSRFILDEDINDLEGDIQNAFYLYGENGEFQKELMA